MQTRAATSTTCLAQIWKWRDWVVDAFNANMPFDQFTIEQLAGDLLPNATLAQKVATGFNRNHPTNSEAGEEEDEYRSAYVVDRVNTTATVFMGVTLACAQCHDHKYDPLSQRDYYSFYAFFNNIKERDSEFSKPAAVRFLSPAPIRSRGSPISKRASTRSNNDSSAMTRHGRSPERMGKEDTRQARQADRVDNPTALGNALSRRLAVEAARRRLNPVNRPGARQRHVRHHVAPREEAHHGAAARGLAR